ncbi:hypothetical protein REPUB_Repub08aG0206100 [Reevesia pubescens]
MGHSNGVDKDKRSRQKMNICKQLVGMLLYMIVGDDSYLNQRNWERRIDLVKKAIEQLKDPELVLKQLKLLMQPIILEQENSGLDVRKAESALEEIQSFLLQSKNIVLPPDSIPLNNGVLKIEAEALQVKEESQSFGECLKQMLATLEQKHQSMSKAKVYVIVGKMLQNLANSCSKVAADEILNQDCANQVQECHGVSPATIGIEGEQLRLDFPQTPNFIPIDEEMIVREKQVKEVTLIIGLVAGRLAELKLGMKKTNQEMGDNFELDSTNGGLSDGPFLAKMWDLPVLEDWDYSLHMDNTIFGNVVVEDSIGCELIFQCPSCNVVKATSNLDECGTSNTLANEVNVKLSPPDEIRIVKSYKVFYRNADALNEIFQQHPDIDEKFRVAHPDSQSFYMNLLAEVYQKIMIINKQEMLELNDITSMELMVQDMELIGLQLTWLKKMLEEVHERSENQAERKRLLEVISSRRAEAEEAEQKLARLEKKPRFW